jgi:rubrerythrin
MGVGQNGKPKIGHRVAFATSCSEAQRKRYPLVCTLLEGELVPGVVLPIDVYTLKISVGFKAMRFSFSCEKTGHSIFGTAEGFDEVMDSIEKQLAEEKFDVKTYERREDRSRDATH